MSDKRLRCAIYTRKSSEEGLEQDFNSLHAQREACEAYIASQKHEGWSLVRTLYDDGGYSGGSMDRPALKQLLADIAAGKIDVIVVYKVDRLTRSLADFAKIVEVFDANKASFVSVTQAFNTTTSMGRLTLNVLLSFAQFEREVTGERIRDKIAASKKKGMWMGGNTPLGYEVKDRHLVIVPEHAELVRSLFRSYALLGSVEALDQKLQREKVITPRRAKTDGSMSGGGLFYRGALYHLLQNPVYIGKIRHKTAIHDGVHQPIVDDALWTEVQAKLTNNRRGQRIGVNAKSASLLAGLIYAEDGRKLIASHAAKNGTRYRYYRTPPNGGRTASASIAAEPIENAVRSILLRHLRDQGWVLKHVRSPSDPQAGLKRAGTLAQELESSDAIARRAVVLDLVSAVRVHAGRIEVDVMTSHLAGISPSTTNKDAATLSEPVSFARRGTELRLTLVADGPADPEPDPVLIKAIAQAHRWWRDLTSGRFATLREIAKAYGTDERYAAFVLRLSFLSPELTGRILQGTQPTGLTLHQLLWKVEIPTAWSTQRRIGNPITSIL